MVPREGEANFLSLEILVVAFIRRCQDQKQPLAASNILVSHHGRSKGEFEGTSHVDHISR